MIPFEERFSVIYADPPWKFRAWTGGTSRTADAHYQTQDIEWICQYGGAVNPHITPTAVLFLWCTPPTVPDALTVMQRWGFRFLTVAFVWHKLNEKPVKSTDLSVAIARAKLEAPDDRASLTTYHGNLYRTAFGLGYYTRGGAEFCLLGARGANPREDASVSQVIHAPLREHSRKPDETYGLIERMYPKARKLELFSRSMRPGWSHSGDERGKFGIVEKHHD